MPIECTLAAEIDEGLDFCEIDRLVMKAAYASHNHFGRLCEEKIYENDVAARLKAEGLTNIATQLPLRVTHQSFRKIYRLDLIVNGFVYELNRDRWQPISANCDKLITLAEELFHHWGGFLDCRVYEQALVWFVGQDRCAQRLPVTRCVQTLGSHKVLQHHANCGFVVTSIDRDRSSYESQLRRLLGALPIQGWQWLNFHHQNLLVTSILK